MKSVGIEFAEVEDAGRCLTKTLGDDRVNGHSFSVSPSRWEQSRYVDSGLEEKPEGNSFWRELTSRRSGAYSRRPISLADIGGKMPQWLGSRYAVLESLSGLTSMLRLLGSILLSDCIAMVSPAHHSRNNAFQYHWTVLVAF